MNHSSSSQAPKRQYLSIHIDFELLENFILKDPDNTKHLEASLSYLLHKLFKYLFVKGNVVTSDEYYKRPSRIFALYLDVFERPFSINRKLRDFV